MEALAVSINWRWIDKSLNSLRNEISKKPAIILFQITSFNRINRPLISGDDDLVGDLIVKQNELLDRWPF